MREGNEMETNGITGDLRVYLERCDLDVDAPAVDLIAWFEGVGLGSDEEPDILFTVKRTTEEEGDSDSLFGISVKRLRALCDLAEAMHKVGRQQWAERLGEDCNG